MKNKALLAVAVIGLVFCPILAAAFDEPEESATASEKKKLSIDWGFDHRFRAVQTDNMYSYDNSINDEQDFFRFRTRFWTEFSFNDSVTFKAQLNDESRKISTPDTPFRFHEVVVEHFYFDVRNILRSDFSLRVGRQDIMKGEGFVIFDGSALDGSRTAYFNAVDLSYHFPKASLELIGISDPAVEDYFPVIHDQEQVLTEWDEKAIGLYYTDHNFKETALDTYYFYKTEEHPYFPETHPFYQPQRRFHTVGGRLARTFPGASSLPAGWGVAGELAYQWGEELPDGLPARGMTGWSGYLHVTKNLPIPWSPYVKFGIYGFSGDEPLTNEVEGWAPIFNRWPKWSELYIYSHVLEGGVARWTNSHMVQCEVGLSPAKNTKARFTFYNMRAFHPQQGELFGPGTKRGNNYQVRVDHIVNKYFRGHVLYERHVPGDFYVGTDPSHFLTIRARFLDRRQASLTAEGKELQRR